MSDILEPGIKESAIESIVPRKFLDYGMSVIVSRAIPDVRDGLKPVHRRILYAMNDLGMTHSNPYKKSARIVGEVIGKYHPHGDSAVYESMVRMAQPWSLRQMLVEGQGNFGSIGNDPPAAMRYTEARLRAITQELLRGIKKRDTDKDGKWINGVVDFNGNYDDTEQEPAVLPARFPNMIVNGAEGIAVGMATKMPPHNLRETCLAVAAQIDNPDITVDELMEYIKGPDFPTGGYIMGEKGIRDAFETGRGSITIRGVVEIETAPATGKQTLRIRQIPYQVNEEVLIAKIKEIQKDFDDYKRERDKGADKKSGKKAAKIVKQKGIDFHEKDGVNNERGSSTPDNEVNIAIQLKRGTTPEVILSYLYKHTPLQMSYSVLNLALVPEGKNAEGRDNLKPQIMGLKKLIYEYIKHQQVVERRSLEWDLRDLREKVHALEGLMKALDKLDETIAVIRASKSKADARESLIALLHIDEIQADYILDMRLQSLASFEQDEKRADYEEKIRRILEIEHILADEREILSIIKNDMLMIAEKYGTDRLTLLKPPAQEISLEDMVEDEEVVVTISHTGHIKRTPQSSYKSQRRNGRGVAGMNTKEEDFVEHLEVAKNHDTLLIFTNNGRVYRIRVFEIPEFARTAQGMSIYNLLSIEKGERIQAVLSIRDFSDLQNVIFATKNGTVKKTKLSEYANIRQNGIAAITLREEKGVMDSVVGVELTNGERNITLVTKKGMSITFDEREVKSVNRTGIGVKGITLGKGDEVVSFDKHEEFGDLFIATNTGYGKRTPLGEFRVQTRGGKGVIVMKLTDKNGEVVGSRVVQEQDALMLITKNGTLIKLLVDSISKISRNTQGTKIMNLRDKDEIQGVARIADGADEDGEDEE
jgi:DNA gyrase subunit A